MLQKKRVSNDLQHLRNRFYGGCTVEETVHIENSGGVLYNCNGCDLKTGSLCFLSGRTGDTTPVMYVRLMALAQG
jgi:hypothetical protein